MLSINTNLSSLIAQNSMKTSTNKLNQAIERMSTGFKINHAKDNAANYAISTNMTTEMNSLMVAEDNTAMGLDVVNTASQILDELDNRIQRLRDLQVQANNGTYGEASLKAINAECNALIDEIDRLYQSAEYNGVTMFLSETTLADGTTAVVRESDAQLDTTFKELGITARHFEIYDSTNTFIQAYDLEEDDTIQDFFDTLRTHGFTSKISAGKMIVQSPDRYYISGDLVNELGITIKDDVKVSYTTESTTILTTTTAETTKTNTIYTTTTTQTTQTTTTYVTTTSETTQTITLTDTTTIGTSVVSSGAVTYTQAGYATGTTDLGQLIDFEGGTKTVNVLNASGTKVATKDFSSTDTVQTFLDFCSTNGITASITNGVISLNSTNNNYLQDMSTNGVLEQLGIGSSSGSVTTTIGKAVKSSSAITTYPASMTESLWSSNLANYQFYYLKISPNNPSVGTETLTINLKTTSFADVVSICNNYSINFYYSSGLVKADDSASNYNLSDEYQEVGNDWASTMGAFTNISFRKTINTSAKLNSIGVSGTTYITVVQNGTDKIVTLSASNTIAQVISKLGSVGVTATLTSGYFSVSASTTAYISGMTSTLASALKVSGKTWSTTTVTTTTTMTPSNEQNATYTRSLVGSSSLSDLGVNTNQIVTVVQNGTEKEVLFNTTDTVNTFITNLAGAGITASVSDGKLTVSGSDTAYIKVMSDTLKSALNLSGNFSAETVTITGTQTIAAGVTTTTTTTATQTLTITTTTSTTETQTLLVTTTSSTTKTTTLWSTATVSTTHTSERQSYDEILEGVYAPGTINLQIGTSADVNSGINVDVSFKLSDLRSVRGLGIDGNDYLERIDEILAQISDRQVHFGAVQNRLESVMEEIAIRYDNLASSRSTIRDADIAEISSEYIRQQILQQASATLLSTANQSPAIALQLI